MTTLVIQNESQRSTAPLKSTSSATATCFEDNKYWSINKANDNVAEIIQL